MKIILILIMLYVVGFFISYKYIQIAHSEKGIWRILKTQKSDLIVCLFPMANILFVLVWIIQSPYNKNYKDYNKFFNVKE